MALYGLFSASFLTSLDFIVDLCEILVSVTSIIGGSEVASRERSERSTPPSTGAFSACVQVGVQPVGSDILKALGEDLPHSGLCTGSAAS